MSWMSLDDDQYTAAYSAFVTNGGTPEGWDWVKQYLDPPVLLYSAPPVKAIRVVLDALDMPSEPFEQVPSGNCGKCGLLVQKRALIDGMCLRCWAQEKERETAEYLEVLDACMSKVQE